MSSGFTDKVYWRQVSTFMFCCFKKCGDDGYQSLCGNRHRDRSGGQSASRPEAIFRCAMCDIEEMKRRGWEESGPVTEPVAGQGMPS